MVPIMIPSVYQLPWRGAQNCRPRRRDMAVQQSTRAYDILIDLGLTPVINVAGAPSRLGQSVLAEPVREAMMAAAQYCIPLSELQQRAGDLIAAATGAEAGCVACGAAACLFL